MDWVQKSIAAAKELDCDTLILFPNHFTSNGCADFRKQYSQDAMIANVAATLTMLVPILEEPSYDCFFWSRLRIKVSMQACQ